MITVAVATRSMERQSRYREQLPEGKFRLVAALDCKMLNIMVSRRPVDVILFDLQRPAMPADEWLGMIEENPEIKGVPTVWIGHDVLPKLIQKIGRLGNGRMLPPTPSAETLIEAVTQVASVGSKRKGIGSGSLWEPGEDTIDQALSIFDLEDNDVDEPNGEFSASEMIRLAAHVGNQPDDDDDTERSEPALYEASKIKVPAGKSAAKPTQSNADLGNLPANAVDEPIMGSPLGKNVSQKHAAGDSAGKQNPLVEQITNQIVGQLAERLVAEILAGINRKTIENLVREKLDSAKSPRSNQPI